MIGGMPRGEWGLPPGVRSSDIPGNGKEEQECAVCAAGGDCSEEITGNGEDGEPRCEKHAHWVPCEVHPGRYYPDNEGCDRCLEDAEPDYSMVNPPAHPLGRMRCEMVPVPEPKPWRVWVIDPDNGPALSIEPGAEALVSVTTYCTGPQIMLHDLTPARAQAIIDALTTWKEAHHA